MAKIFPFPCPATFRTWKTCTEKKQKDRLENNYTMNIKKILSQTKTLSTHV